MTCNDIITKPCNTCTNEKPLTDFYKYKRNSDGHQSDCKICQKERTAANRLTKDGVIATIYDSQKQHSKSRNHQPPSYSQADLSKWLINKPLFHALYESWISSGHDRLLKPSCDRKDDYKPYTLDNIQLMTWEENKKKGESDMRNGINNKNSRAVIQLTKEGEFIAEYYSMKHAAREIGVKRASDITACCRGVQKTAYGFAWNYK